MVDGFVVVALSEYTSPKALSSSPMPVASPAVCVHPDHRDAISSVLERNGFLTQGDLAAHLLIALSTVNNFCRGIRVSVAKFEQISEALGLDPHEIILPKGDRTPSDKAYSSTAPTPLFFAYDSFWVGCD